MKIAEIKISYSSTQDKRIKVKESYNAFRALLDIWNIETIELHEEVKVILLNRASEILGFYNLAKGGVSGCYVDIKLILSIALKANASSIILAHNHPSGNLIPSKSDKSITAKLKEACEQVDLSLLDHLIVSKKDYFSFADNVLL